MTDLSRFHDAQNGDFDTALSELVAGQKQSHWMWFVFPQIRGLGRSAMAGRYGIADLEEARAYLQDPVLARRLELCVRAVLKHRGKSIVQILGGVDAMKLRSCATLFETAGGGADFAVILDGFFDGERCQKTLNVLATRSG